MAGHNERADGGESRAALFLFATKKTVGRQPVRKKGGGRLKKKREKGWRTALAGMACLAMLLGLTGEQFRAGAAWSPGQQGGAVSRRVVPLGRAVGIKLFSDGVLVVGLSAIETDQGSKSPGKDCGLKLGDVITHVDGDQVDTIQQVQTLVARHKDQPLTIQAMRGEKQMQLTAAPVANRQGTYQLGVWLRDSMAGIGTMTFWDPDTGVFAALGHGINDVDTAALMPLESGGIMAATVSGVERGRVGAPGELHGDFDLTADLGSLYANTSQGVFGRTAQPLSDRAETVEVARADQVRTGPATILSNIRGDQVEEFQVEITHVSRSGDGTRNLMLEVTDPRLLSATGGIVQGMSGSPILQDGRLAGAVTHVLIDDPTRGYGIFAENMCRAAD